MADQYRIVKIFPGESSFALFDKVIDVVYDNVDKRLLMNDINTAFLKEVCIILKNDVPSGRLVLYDNPGLHYSNNRIVTIGNYECVDDELAAKYLLSEAIATSTKEEANKIIGPMSGSTWDNYRFSLEHKYPLFLLEPYHHIYYNSQFENNGFKIIANYISLKDEKMQNDYPEVKKREEQLKSVGVVFRSIDLLNFDKELDQLYELSCLAFSENLFYSSISKEHFKKKYLAAKSFIDLAYTIVAEHNSIIVGFVFAYRNLLNRTNSELIIKTLVRHPKRLYAGMGSVLTDQVYEAAKKHEVQSIIHAFMHTDNASTTMSTGRYSGVGYKKYALYGLELK